jgi:hypothetical protein
VSSQKTLAALRLLSEQRIEYIVVGMVAGVLHGAPVTTFDLDIVHHRTIDNVDRLLTVLQQIRAVYRGDPRNLTPDHPRLMGPGHHLLTTTLGDLDLLGAITDEKTYEDLLDDSEFVQLGDGLHTRIVTLTTLIALKRRTGRPKDIAVLPVLEATLAERARSDR